jgi:hypothetical protein
MYICIYIHIYIYVHIYIYIYIYIVHVYIYIDTYTFLLYKYIYMIFRETCGGRRGGIAYAMCRLADCLGDLDMDPLDPLNETDRCNAIFMP